MQNAGIAPDIVALNTVCDVCCSAGFVPEAINVLRQFPHIAPNIKTYSILLKGYTRMSVPQPDKVMELLKVMEREGCRPDIVTYNIVLKCLCDANKVNDCVVLLRKIKSSNFAVPDRNTYIILMNVFCRSGMFREAAEVILEARNCGYNFDMSAFNILFSSCKTETELEKIVYTVNYILPYANITISGDLLQFILKTVENVEYAKVIMSTFEAKGITITTSSLNILLQMHVNCNDVFGGYNFLSKLCRAMEQYRAVVNGQSYTIIIEGCCVPRKDASPMSGDLPKTYPIEAFNMLRLFMISPFIPTSQLCHTVINAFQDNFTGMNEVFNFLKEHSGKVPLTEETLETFIREKLRFLLKSRQYRVMFNVSWLEEEIIEVVRYSGASFSVLRAYEIIIEMLCRCDNFYLAYEIFCTKQAAGELLPTLELYHTLFMGWGAISTPVSPDVKIIQDLMSLMQSNGFIIGVETYNVIITSMCKKRCVMEAYEVLKRMRESGKLPSKASFETIAATCVDLAKEQQIKDPNSHLVISSFLLTAQEIIQDMFSAGFVPAPYLVEAMRVKNYSFMKKPVFPSDDMPTSRMHMSVPSTSLFSLESKTFPRVPSESSIFDNIDLFGLGSMGNQET
jgi:pentatricopeptide repeat protein